jgi:hypothetical protein
MPAWAGRAFAADDGILRARLYNDINRLDPAIYENAYNVDVMGLIYPKLIGYKPNVRPLGVAARGWPRRSSRSMTPISASG